MVGSWTTEQGLPGSSPALLSSPATYKPFTHWNISSIAIIGDFSNLHNWGMNSHYWCIFTRDYIHTNEPHFNAINKYWVNNIKWCRNKKGPVVRWMTVGKFSGSDYFIILLWGISIGTIRIRIKITIRFFLCHHVVSKKEKHETIRVIASSMCQSQTLTGRWTG